MNRWIPQNKGCYPVRAERPTGRYGLWLLAVVVLVFGLTACSDQTGRIIGKSVASNIYGQPRYYVTLQLQDGTTTEEEVKSSCYFKYGMGDCVRVDWSTEECTNAECE